MARDSDNIWEQIHQLEEKAGIKEQAEKARQGAFIPYGVFDEPELDPDDPGADSNNYFDDEWDHERGKTRNAYFSIADMEVRKELIATRRKLDATFRKAVYGLIQEGERELAMAEGKSKRGGAWIAGAGTVFMYMVFGAVIGNYFEPLGVTLGAIFGLGVGFFMGNAAKEKEQANLDSMVKVARHAVDDARKEFRDTTEVRPEFFSLTEEISGEVDPESDRQLAMANRSQLRRQRRGEK